MAPSPDAQSHHSSGHSFVERLPFPIAELDGDLSVVWANAAWRRVGAPADGAWDHWSRTLGCSDGDRARLRDLLERGLTGLPTRTEMDVPALGLERHARCLSTPADHGVVLTIVPLRSPSGAAVRGVHPHLLEELYAPIADGVLLLDRDLRIGLATGSAANVAGRTGNAIEGRSVLDEVHPDDRDRVTAAATTVLGRPGERVALDVRMRTEPGGHRWVEAVATNLLDHPSVRSILVTLRDITARRAAEEARATEERRFRSLTESSPVGVFQTDREGVLVYANERFRALVGSHTGDRPWQLVEPGERDRLAPRFRSALATGRGFQEELRLVDDAGVGGAGAHILSVSTSPLADPDGTITGLVGSVLDVTEQHAARELTEQLVGVLDVTPDVVVMADGTGRPLFANRALLELLGEPSAASLHDVPSLGELIRTMIHQLPREVVQGAASRSWHGEVPCRLRDGDELLLSMVVVVEHDDGGSLRLVAGVGRNITHRKRYEAELLHQASHDTLTGLPNRSTLLGHLGEVLVRQQHQPDLLAVLFFDLDNLKQVNDTSGHDAGDAMLVAIADRLRHALRPSDVVGRLGGDEFVAVCEGVGSLTDAEDLAERLNEMVRLPVHAAGEVLHPSASVGVVVTGPRRPVRSSPERDASALLHEADQAMYVAKRSGRGRVHLLHADHHDPSLPERASELLWAVVREELHLAFQPLVSLASGRVTGTEALLRWNHPVHGLLQPGSFLEVAERSGVIGELDGWVLEAALDQLARWRSRAGAADELCIHVNVSNLRLGDRRLVPMVANILDAHRLPPSSLAVEVALRHEPPHPLVVRSAAQLAERGVRIVLDDAGCDSSSLELARRIHAVEVKLDGSVAASMGTDDTALRSFVQQAHGMGFAVAAKWVASQGQAERLQLAGCDTAQGHAFGSPVRADEFAGRYLERRPGVTN